MRILLTAALLSSLGIGPPADGHASVSGPTGAAGESFQVTLITGDRVRVTRRDGWYDAQVEPRPGRMVPVTVQPGREHAYVIPGDAFPLIQRGILDRRLFDVAGLVEQGYDDRHALPLLVSGTRSLPGVRANRALRRIGLTAVRIERGDAARAWSTLRTGGTRIWLDAKVRPVLDQSVPQVGAPSAWQAGYTGRGQTVAVLDTGYDAEHPDLAGKVSAARNFSDDPSVQDTDGHGTHVASTIAGSGAASQGRYRGVAPDAKLLIGKVLGADGGTESSVLAGVEWAVEQRARVVSMSLGRFDSPGTDPLEAAIDRLGKATLFVVAAGNFGGPETISSPGTAAAALTVGSVSKADVLSDFSSRGPVADTRLVKPELTGPGEDVVAARAAGTLDDVAVGEHYARLSGTSMATPHVAGAAALLAQRHPGWTGEQLKAALVGSAHAVADAGVYEQGAGRLDAVRAIGDVVAAGPASLDLGRLLWPHDQGGSGSRVVTYRNDGTAAVTLDLSVTATGEDGSPVPDGTVELTGDRVTVPAGGMASVTVRYDLAKAAIGQLGGWLVATGAGQSVRIPLAGYKEPERYAVTASLLGRDGKPVPADLGEVAVVDTATRQWYSLRNGETLRLPPGVYGATGIVLTPRQGEPAPALTMMGKRHFTVTSDMAVSFDARTARRLRVEVDPADDRPAMLTLGSSHQTGIGRPGHLEISTADDYLDEVYLGGYQDRHPDQLMYFRQSRIATDARLTVEGPERFEVPVWWAPHSVRLDTTLRLGLVDGGAGRPEDLQGKDVRGKAVLVTPEEGAEVGKRAQAVAGAGGKAVVVRLRARVWSPETETVVPVLYSHRGAADRLLAAERISLRLSRNTPYVYDIARPLLSRLPDVVRLRDHELAAVRTDYPDALGANGRAYLCPEAFYGPHLVQVGGCAGGIALPHRQTVFYTPDLVEYLDSYNVGVGEAYHPLHLETGVRVAKAGSRHRVAWGAPVFGPGLRGVDDRPAWAPPVAHRADGAVQVAIPLLADGDGHHNWTSDQEFGAGMTTLHRNGSQVGTSEQAGVGRFEIPDGPADLKLATRFERTEPSWRLSTLVSAIWSVRSDGDGVLPLIAIRYRPRVGPDGSAPGNTAYDLPISVERETGTPDVRRLSVEVSYDDGQTWRTVPTRRGSDGWRALLAHPATGHVSLRAHAVDADGNEVEQTIIRGYAVR